MKKRYSMAALALAGSLAPYVLGQGSNVHLNQIQVIGSHNSYHTGFAPSERKLVETKNPKALRALDYAHQPLPAQLDGGVRQIEIDVYADKDGGRFAHPAIVDQVAKAGLPADPDFDPNREMLKPGFKVMHVRDVDQRSSCHTFVRCLQIVRDWSQAHPQHVPIFILVETKKAAAKDHVDDQPWTPAVFDALDAEVSSVFKPSEMVSPDQVRGEYATLPEAVSATGKTVGKKGGWPTLAASRGKVVLLLDQRPVTTTYTEGHIALRGRVFFTNSIPGTPDGAFTEMNDGKPAEIQPLVQQGYLVRTRTDDSTEEARANDHRRAEAALSSGAQMLSTDYPKSEPASWTGFFVSLPNGVAARCNPVNAPSGCVDSALERK